MSQILEFDRTEMRERFDHAPFRIGHRLADHPLLELPRLVELAAALPEKSVEYNAGNLPIGQDPAATPRTGLGVAETLRRLEECNSWLVLKDVEREPAYRALLDECLDQVEPVLGASCPGMTGRKAFIFVSSPAAVTPYHVDFEYNFLLQVRGEKLMTVFDPADRMLLSEEQRERAVCGAPRNLPFREEFAAKGVTFALRPGEGVHVPLSSPHWVKVGANVSISLSLTFQSRASDRRIGAHRTNALLRKWGLSPTEVGRSPRLDSMKFNVHRLLRRFERIAHGVNE